MIRLGVMSQGALPSSQLQCQNMDNGASSEKVAYRPPHGMALPKPILALPMRTKAIPTHQALSAVSPSST